MLVPGPAGVAQLGVFVRPAKGGCGCVASPSESEPVLVGSLMGTQSPNTPTPSGPEVYLLDLPEVERRTSLKKSTIYALMAKDEFPHNVQITARRKGWFSNEVQEWILSRRPSRD